MDACKTRMCFGHGVLNTCVFVSFATKHVVLLIEAAPVSTSYCLLSLLACVFVALLYVYIIYLLD